MYYLNYTILAFSFCNVNNDLLLASGQEKACEEERGDNHDNTHDHHKDDCQEFVLINSFFSKRHIDSHICVDDNLTAL